MLQIGRRRLILGAAAALLLPKPAIIRSPGLLMNVRPAVGSFEQMNALQISGDPINLLRSSGWTTWTGHDGATWASKGGFTRRYGGRLVKPNRTVATSFALESGLVRDAQDADISDMPAAYIATAEKGQDFWGINWDAVDAEALRLYGPPHPPGAPVILKPLKDIA